jgi:HlyD family secretion protein
MHPNPKRIFPLFLLLMLVIAGTWYVRTRVTADGEEILAASGTIEATQVKLAAESGGRLAEIYIREGELVRTGQILARQDDSLLTAQLAQSIAALETARANYALVAAGPGDAQRRMAVAATELEVLVAQQALDQLKDGAELAVSRAQQSVAVATKELDTAERALDRLPSSAEDIDRALLEASVLLTRTQLDEAVYQLDLLQNSRIRGVLPDALAQAEARLAAAQARHEAAQAGPTPEQLAVADAQVASAEAAVALLETQLDRLEITAPLDGVILARLVEPGEVVMPGAALATLADLEMLTITVYIPEDRYGLISLDQHAMITVDSFPGRSFTGTVVHIAGQAEFTPRNVQTAEGRRSTVFAIKLAISNPQAYLKPGMPADVLFGE